MANNRMWLKNKKTGAQVLLAKYYPSGGWYGFDIEEGDLSKRLTKVFDENPGREGTVWGNNDWVIEYETDRDA